MSGLPILGYWNIRGLCQSIRLLLGYAGVEFQEKHYVIGDGPEFSYEDWYKEKFCLGELCALGNYGACQLLGAETGFFMFPPFGRRFGFPQPPLLHRGRPQIDAKQRHPALSGQEARSHGPNRDREMQVR